jgi:hypothetical protein
MTTYGITTYDTRAAEILLRDEGNWIGFFPGADDKYTRVDSEGECISVTHNLTWLDCLVQAVGAYTSQPIEDIKPEIDHLLSELDGELPHGLANTVKFFVDQEPSRLLLQGIVKNLADMDPVLTEVYDDAGMKYMDHCALCRKPMKYPDDLDEHAEDCPWRRARAWGSAHREEK